MPQTDALTNYAIPTIQSAAQKKRHYGAPYWTRTSGLLLRRQLLYPAELKAQGFKKTRKTEFGAGDGNRTHVTSLEGWNSTIELHPRKYRPLLRTIFIISRRKMIVKRFFQFLENYFLDVTFMPSSFAEIVILLTEAPSLITISATLSSTFFLIKFLISRAPYFPP